MTQRGAAVDDQGVEAGGLQGAGDLAPEAIEVIGVAIEHAPRGYRGAPAPASAAAAAGQIESPGRPFERGMAQKRIRLKVASPCKVSWETMRGDDAVRFCGECKKNVYSLANMTTEAVEALLTGAGETPCVRFFQRADGTVMTSDCSVGAARARRKRAAVAFGAGVLSAVGVALAPSASPSSSCALEASAGTPAEVAEQAVPVDVDGPDVPVEDELVLGQPVYVERQGKPVIELRGEPVAIEVYDTGDE